MESLLFCEEKEILSLLFPLAVVQLSNWRVISELLGKGNTVTPLFPHLSFPAPPPARTAAAVVAFHLVAAD